MNVYRQPISELFDTSLLAEAMKDVPVNVKDRKGNATTAKGRADLFPVLLKLGEEYTSYRLTGSASTGTPIFASTIKPYMLKAKEALDPFTMAYVKAAQAALGEEMGVDLDGMKENGVDGFQLDPNDPRITPDMLRNVYDRLDAQFPTGPLTQEVLDALLKVADATLQATFDKGDQYIMYVSTLITNAVLQFVNQATTIVNREVLGPIQEIINYKQYLAQQQQEMQAQNKKGPGLVGLSGEKLTTDSLNTIVTKEGPKKIVN